jgi:hypothetical protein
VNVFPTIVYVDFETATNPLLIALNAHFPGVRIGRRTHPAAIAYADDVTVFLTSPTEVPILCEALTTYEKASGAQINKENSRILGLGTWDTTTTILDIPYSETLTILGTHITKTIQSSCEMSWGRRLTSSRQRRLETMPDA